MFLPAWLVRLGLAATLLSSSVLCAGWKWDHLLP
jgi:hypothetical protein